MYESFYHLSQRPFAAAPDANLFVATPAVAEALSRLERCVRQARGVGVLTGGAGIGKTHLLHRLVISLQEEFGVICVPNASFPSPRGLLQFLLAEFGESYERLSETELRLRLTVAANDARAATAGIVLLLDETHRYSDRMLEEIRLLANQIEASQPLFRIVIAGQIDLEDRLAEGGQDGLNERIGEFVTLPRLTSEESRIYLAQRASQAGGELEALFEPAALDILVQACGGIPRCLNQLADHALLLGSVAERAMVSESLLREALEDLKRLPLQWHDPRPVARGAEEEKSPRRPQEGKEEETFDSVIEIGSLDDSDDCDVECSIDGFAESLTSEWDNEQEVFEPEMPGESRTVEAPRRQDSPPPAPPLESISDRFARLDAAQAQRRWLESWDETDEQHEIHTAVTDSQSIAPIGPMCSIGSTTIENQSMEFDESRDNAICETSEPTTEHRQETETDDDSVDQSPMRGGWHAAPKSATLFRDLRRRQGLS